MINDKQIIESIADSLGLPVADVDLESSLRNDLGLNPVEVADLLDELAVKFKIIFSHEETGGLKTVGDLVEIIEDKLLE